MVLLTRALFSMCRGIPVMALLDDDMDDTTEFAKLSGDVLLSIFQRLSAKDLVSVSLVCRTWNVFAKDGTLWEALLRNEVGCKNWKAVLFAECYLRPGCAVRSPILPPPYRAIYNQRLQVPRSVIIDTGCGYCKYGWSDQNEPLKMLPTFLEFGNIESPVYPRLKDLFSTILQRMKARASSQPLVLTAPISHSDDTDAALAARRQLREITCTALFELGVPAICSVDQAVLALFAANRTSGIVVNIGFHVTSIVPVLHGKVMRSIGVEIVGQGGMQLTVHLSELMQRNQRPSASMHAIRTLKEKLCYVAQDFEEEMNKPNLEATLNTGDEGVFTLEEERFRAPEILFQPRIGQLRTMSLQQAVALCIEHSASLSLKHKAADDSWFKTIVLSGGTACLPGLGPRLKKEVTKALSPSSLATGLDVIAPAHGPDLAWFGAKLLSNLSTFPNAWCVTKKQFRRYGSKCVHSMAFEEGC